MKIVGKFFTVALALFIVIQAQAQTGRVDGRVVDARKKNPITGVFVRLSETGDTSKSRSAVTSADGKFSFDNMPYHAYQIAFRIVGHAPIVKNVTVNKPAVQLGDITMTEAIIPIKENVVEGTPPPTIQKADTTEFNAGAFRTNPDANAGDLVSKLPGVTVDNTGVKAQGENVQQVLLDGRPFFGSDPMVALQNLPADVVDKIQVFDKLSDQAEFTGFDDGQSVKTMNIISRRDRPRKDFGKMYGGYGDDQRYIGGGGVSDFAGDMRLSLIGLSNNVNQQNFSNQDLLGVLGTSGRGGGPGAVFRGGGGGGRRGGGNTGGSQFRGGGGGGGGNASNNFLVGSQNGITTTSSIGANYTDKWGSDLLVNQSYFFNYAGTENNQFLRRQYLGTPDSTQLYNENTQAGNRNFNHRYDARFEYTADSSNSLIEQPRLYFQNNSASNLVDGANSLSTGQLLNQAINQTANNNQTSTSGYNLSNHIVFRHRFEQRGRTLSVDIGLAANRKQGTASLLSNTEYYGTTTNLNDTLDQQSPLLTTGSTLSSRMAYTEPVGTFGQIQLTYFPSYSWNKADNEKYQFDSLTRDYSIQIPSLSNTYKNRYGTQNAGAGFHFRSGQFNGMVNLAYQVASSYGEQVYPKVSTVNRSFYNILPNAMLTYNIAEHTNLRLIYSSTTRPPSINQLQNVVDNTNPLLLASGNPNLNQSLSQSLVARYLQSDGAKGQSLFFVGSLGFVNDYIGSTTLTARRDTVLAGGVVLNRGGQLTIPVNLDNYWTARLFSLYGFPAEFLGGNVNLNTGVTFSQTPGMINGSTNLARTTALSAGTALTSNISEDVDYSVSYTGAYNISSNTLTSQQNGNYYSHTGGIKVNLIFWDGFVLRNELMANVYSGLSAGYNQNSTLWNINFGKKFMTDQRADLRLIVNDVLNQNTSVTRSITDTYVQDSQNDVLQRYYMLQFTYTVR